ncbi:hypothetical protein, partial [Anabaena sp. 4-3]|uniref:hypothetical protein n=1 Tax=Anabaena sp. 4-3 TaxID=1811979 RepID=UPI001E52C9B5
FDCFSSYSPWIYDNGQPARFSDSPIYRFICGKVRTPTLKLACLFNTVGWVVNHLYSTVDLTTSHTSLTVFPTEKLLKDAIVVVRLISPPKILIGGDLRRFC